VIAIILAIIFTWLSFWHQWYAPGIVGNICGPEGNEKCNAPVLRAGFPFAYVVDNTGVSVVGKLEDVLLVEHFVISTFLLDVLIYTIAIYGIYTLLVRKKMQRSFDL
jgi:hypothetical protein